MADFESSDPVGSSAAGMYIAIGYYYRNTFYRELNELTGEEIAEAIPEPQNAEQELYVELIKKVHNAHLNQLQKLFNEKRDHQDFSMSWIHEVKLPITASRLLMENSAGKNAYFLVDKFEDELGKIDNYVEQAL